MKTIITLLIILSSCTIYSQAWIASEEYFEYESQSNHTDVWDNTNDEWLYSNAADIHITFLFNVNLSVNHFSETFLYGVMIVNSDNIPTVFLHYTGEIETRQYESGEEYQFHAVNILTKSEKDSWVFAESGYIQLTNSNVIVIFNTTNIRLIYSELSIK